MKRKDKQEEKKIKSFSGHLINILALFFVIIFAFLSFPSDFLNHYSLAEVRNGDLLPISSDKHQDLVLENNDNIVSQIKTETRPLAEIIGGDNVQVNNDPYIFLGSFGYSLANFDKEKSSLRFDLSTAGVSFFPDYEFKEIDKNALAVEIKNKFSNLNFNNFSGPYYEKRCLATNCLEQKNLELFYNNRLLTLPSLETFGFKESDIVALSIGSLEKNWLVGITLKSDSIYYGLVYRFNGQNFSLINFPQSISSTYFGVFGFGGIESDFIVLYGGAKGIAYRIRDNNFTSISEFFDFRIMANGFKAEIIRQEIPGERPNWYVYSLTKDRPTFIKLWQNNSLEISGQLVLIDDLSLRGENLALVYDSRSNDLGMFIYLKNNGSEKYFSWRDLGFKNNHRDGFLISKSLPFAAEKTVNVKHLFKGGVINNSDSDNFIKLELIVDNKSRFNLGLKNEGDLDIKNAGNYVLSLNFLPVKNKFNSPFVRNIFFDYGYQKF